MNIHDVGKRGFWHAMTYPKMTPPPPLTEKGATQETEEPYRFGRSRVLRLPFTRRALVIGVWEDIQYPEHIALEQATGLREMHTITMDEIRSWESEEYDV